MEEFKTQHNLKESEELRTQHNLPESTPQSPLFVYQPNMYSMIGYPMQENFAAQGMWHSGSIPLPFNHYHQGVAFTHAPGSAFGGFRRTSPPTVQGMSSMGSMVPMQGSGGMMTFRPMAMPANLDIAGAELPGQGGVAGAQYQVPTTMHPQPFTSSNEMMAQQAFMGGQGLKRSISYQSVMQPAFYPIPGQSVPAPNPDGRIPTPVQSNQRLNMPSADIQEQVAQSVVNRSPEQRPHGMDSTGPQYPNPMQPAAPHPSHVRQRSGTEKIDLTRTQIPESSEEGGVEGQVDGGQVERKLEEARPGGLNQGTRPVDNAELDRVSSDGSQDQTAAAQHPPRRKGTFADDKFKNLADLSKPVARPSLDERKVSLNDLKRAKQQQDLQGGPAGMAGATAPGKHGLPRQGGQQTDGQKSS